MNIGHLKRRLSGYSDDLNIRFAISPGGPAYEIASIYNSADLKEGQENILWIDLEPVEEGA